MKVEFPEGKEAVWLFDAKYRIKPNAEHADDEVPDDALNQTHRYRDSLIYLSKVRGQAKKSRPVFGAFALYPGFHEQLTKESFYKFPIDEVGIGAFPLLPDSAESEYGCIWLKQFLEEQLGGMGESQSAAETHENLYLQEAARIPLYGLEQTLYPDLVMTAPVIKNNRSLEYVEGFQIGTAKWYHTRVSTFKKKTRSLLPSEIKYLALSVDTEATRKRIDYVWLVEQVNFVSSEDLTAEQTGSERRGAREEYVLFKLGRSFKLDKPIDGVPVRPTTSAIVFVDYGELLKCEDFSGVLEAGVYRSV